MNPRSITLLDEHANHYTTNESAIYHTLDEHANHYTTNESTIYHTLDEHANHYTTNAVSTMYYNFVYQ